MGQHKRDEFSSLEFAERLEQALKMNPNAPPKFHGERVWLSEQMMLRGKPVSTETVRKWTKGLAMPAHDKVPVLAECLGVDAEWLLYGGESARKAQARVQHGVNAAAATNLVAGIIQMSGSDAVFPAPGCSGSVHLNAIIKRVSYPLHIVVGKPQTDGTARFEVPATVSDAIVIGVLPAGDGFSYRLFEIDEDQIAGAEMSRTTRFVTVNSGELREITSFSDRL